MNPSIVKERQYRSIMLRIDEQFAAWLKQEAARVGISVPAYTRTLKIVHKTDVQRLKVSR